MPPPRRETRPLRPTTSGNWRWSPATAISYVPPLVLAGQARIWFYRDWLPSESLNLANIDVNGVYFGSVANGSSFYRDVPAGHYHIAPVSYNRDINQDRDVDLAAGQQLYVKILSSQSWDGACRDCVRDTLFRRRSRKVKSPACVVAFEVVAVSRNQA
jgi:hypothetical protein